MKPIGFDKNGDEHIIPDSDDPGMHKLEVLCGCNPDPAHDETIESYMRGEKPNWFWIHHNLGK